MPTHSETRHLPYAADEMYTLVSDIERYPEFLPWTAATRIRSRTPVAEGVGEVVEADMVISFRVFRERFGSRVELWPDERRIEVSYLDGPFKKMRNSWKFEPTEDGGCRVDFFVDFEFKSWTLQKLIGVVFDQAMRRVVQAFEARAESLYGRSARNVSAADLHQPSSAELQRR